jgi:hypothetical protein
MIEYKILKPLPFFLEGYRVTEEELEKQFTRDAIKDLEESGFISKLPQPEHYKFWKAGTTIEVNTPAGVKFTREVLDEFSKHIFGEKEFKEANISIPSRNSEFFKKWQEQMFESIGANNPNLSEEEKQSLLKRYPTILKGYFDNDSSTRDCKKEALDILAEGLEANSHFNYYTAAGQINALMDELGFIPRRGKIIHYDLRAEKIDKKEPEIKIPKFEEIKRLGGYFLNHRNFINSIRDGHKTTENYNVYPTEELARAAQVQGKLYQCYHEAIRLNCPDWKYNWSDYETKWCIASFIDRLTVETTYNYKYPFPFPTKELAQAFLDTHKEDLEIYKPLM